MPRHAPSARFRAPAGPPVPLLGQFAGACGPPRHRHFEKEVLEDCGWAPPPGRQVPPRPRRGRPRPRPLTPGPGRHGGGGGGAG
eukprot:11186162-Lingulodinium_polyedra.AAC.1